MKLSIKYKKYLLLFIILFFFILSLFLSNINHAFSKDKLLIAAYIDGEYSSTLPSKGSGYTVDKIVCDNDENAVWDYNKWGVKISNWSSKSKCNVYFKSLESFTIANKTFYLDEVQRCPTMNDDGTVTFTDTELSFGYLCKAKDVYGDSYFYRGNVTNNYVKFGKWSDDTPDIVYSNFRSGGGGNFKEYSSLEECQNKSVPGVVVPEPETELKTNNCILDSRAGKDMYWRIVRFNGDGTVRVIYDGTKAHSNFEESIDRQIGTSAFNLYWKKDNVRESANSSIIRDNAAMGYMYGNRDGFVEGSSQVSTLSFSNNSTYNIAKEYNYDASTGKFTLKNPIAVKGSAMTSNYVGYYTFSSNYTTSDDFIYKITSVTAGSSRAEIGYNLVIYGTTSREKAQAYTNSSDIKTYLDTWYENNIKGTNYERYITDNIFCNDRSTENTQNDGYGPEPIAYRWASRPWATRHSNIKNKYMMLKCPRQVDAFTVDDTTNGNGALTYKVGLITTDEVVMAGGWSLGRSKYNYYLSTGQHYWTMSPMGGGTLRIVYYDGAAGRSDEPMAGYQQGDYTSHVNGVRPVLNLSSEVLKNGDGTASNPFHS